MCVCSSGCFRRRAQADVQPTPYPGNGPYRTYLDPTENGQKMPLFRIDGGEYVAIPFCATERIDPTIDSITAQTDDPNVQTINPIQDTEVDTFSMAAIWT